MSARELSRLARAGSGSAARSIFGGFVRMHAGPRDDDAYAEPIASALTSRVRMVIAVIGGGVPKVHGSRDAMEHVAATSPLYDAWLALVPRDLEAAHAALELGDLGHARRARGGQRARDARVRDRGAAGDHLLATRHARRARRGSRAAGRAQGLVGDDGRRSARQGADDRPTTQPPSPQRCAA